MEKEGACWVVLAEVGRARQTLAVALAEGFVTLLLLLLLVGVAEGNLLHMLVHIT